MPSSGLNALFPIPTNEKSKHYDINPIVHLITNKGDFINSVFFNPLQFCVSVDVPLHNNGHKNQYSPICLKILT